MPRAFFSYLVLCSQHSVNSFSSRWREMISTRTRRNSSTSIMRRQVVCTMQIFLLGRLSHKFAVSSHWSKHGGGATTIARAPPREPSLFTFISSKKAKSCIKAAVLPRPASCAHRINCRSLAAAFFTNWRWWSYSISSHPSLSNFSRIPATLGVPFCSMRLYCADFSLFSRTETCPSEERLLSVLILPGFLPCFLPGFSYGVVAARATAALDRLFRSAMPRRVVSTTQ